MSYNDTPDARSVLDIYMSSGGLVSLTIDRINKRYYPLYDSVDAPSEPHFDESQLFVILCSPQIEALFGSAARTQILMHTFQAANEAIAAMRSKLTFQEPFEAAKTANYLISRLQELTAPQSSNTVNINTQIWTELIPQEAREAIEFLKHKQLPTPQTIEYEELVTYSDC